MTARDDIGEVALRVTVRFEERPRLERGDAHRVGPERRDIVRIVLESEDLVGVADGRLAEGVDEGRVDVADLEADPRLVERPGGLDAHTHADLVDGYFLNEVEESDIGAVEEDRGADVRYLDGGAGEGDVDDAEGRDGTLVCELHLVSSGDAAGGA